jgi:hypothetical protein
MTGVLMTDHPGWESSTSGVPLRLLRRGGEHWLARWDGPAVRLEPLQSAQEHRPTVIIARPEDLPPRTPPRLASELASPGASARVANPWLWDAITTALLRRVVRAGQARALYRRWCQTHGMSMARGDDKLALPPGPQAVLALPLSAFAETGARFHYQALRAAAAAYGEHSLAWSALPAEELAVALGQVAGIGPWTARAAAADYTGDFSVYPHGDLAVRSWARDADPEHPWPSADAPFAHAWRSLADTPSQLSTLTQLTLARGCHARSGPGPVD